MDDPRPPTPAPLPLPAVLAASAAWAVIYIVGAAREAAVLALGGASLLVIALAVRRGLRPDVSRAARDVPLGLVVGAALYGGTRLFYDLAAPVFPPLADDVAAVYAALAPDPALAPVVLVIVVAEELLWRRWCTDALGSGPAAVAGSALIYAVAQVGSGSVTVVAAAVGLGLVWGALRRWSRGLLAPVLSHAVWTFGVVVFLPLGAGG